MYNYARRSHIHTHTHTRVFSAHTYVLTYQCRRAGRRNEVYQRAKWLTYAKTWTLVHNIYVNKHIHTYTDTQAYTLDTYILIWTEATAVMTCMCIYHYVTILNVLV